MAPGLERRKLTADQNLRRKGSSKRAYVTFLAGDGDYVKGVVGLAKGLRKVKAARPFVVAVLPDVPREHRELSDVAGVPRAGDRARAPSGLSQTQFAMAYYVINYSKLRIWGFEEYERMIYLDADIQVYDNIDHLFSLPRGHLYAVKDCFCEATWRHTAQHRVGYCQQCPGRVTWREEEMGPRPPLYFNAGMLVLEPSADTRDRMLSALHVIPVTPFAEQDFLNAFFRDVYKPILTEYNLVMAMLWRHPENVKLDKVKVVHYCAKGSKPWCYTGKEENMDRDDLKMLVSKWWEVYDDESLNYKDEGSRLDVAPADVRRSALSEVAPVTYFQSPSAA